MIKNGVTEPRSDLKKAIDEVPFSGEGFIADTVLPRIGTKDKSGTIYKKTAGTNNMDRGDLSRPKGGTYKRVEWIPSNDTFISEERGIESPIEVDDIAVWKEVWDIALEAMNRSRDGLELERELAVSQAIFNATTFSGSTNTLAITHEWDDADNSVPRSDIDKGVAAIKGKCGVPRYNLALIAADDVINNILKTDEVVNSIKYTSAIPMMSREQKLQFLADYFQIGRIIPATPVYNGSALGVDPSFSDVWSNEYAFLAQLSPASNDWEGGLGRQPVWEGIHGKDSYVAESYAEPQTNSYVYRARNYRGTKIFTKFGFLFSNVTTI